MKQPLFHNQALRRMLRLIGRFRLPFFWLCLLEVGASCFSLAAPYFSKLFIDQAFLGRDMARFVSIATAGAAVFVFTLVMYCLNSWLKNRLRITMPLAIKNVFLRHLYSLDLSSLQYLTVGERAQRAAEAESVADFLIDEVPGLVSGLVSFLVSLAVALWIDARMTAAVILLSPLFLLRSVYFQKKMRQVYEDIWQVNMLVAARVHESFDKMFFIKSFGLEMFQRHQIIRAVIAALRCKVKSFKWELVSFLSMSFLTKAVYGAVMLYGGWLIIEGRTTLGNYSAVMLYLTTIGSFVESIGQKIENASQQRVTVSHMLEILNAPPERSGRSDGAGSPAACPVAGAVCFKDVSFAYPGRQPLFSRVNLSLPAGGWLGMAGPSGIGKSTLLSLIVRLYDQWQGAITIDGADLRDYDLRSLRHAVSLVSQQPFLFNASVRDNLAGDIKNISAARLEEACRLCCIHEEIVKLPGGYQTVIGEDACRLSQGQKQRLCIARALLREPVILMLDEATSSLHAEVEARILGSLRKQRNNRTTIIVSHRQEPLRYTDTVVFLSQHEGFIAGTHDALLGSQPAYRSFFHQMPQKP